MKFKTQNLRTKHYGKDHFYGYKCDIKECCDSTFPYKSDLKRHQKTLKHQKKAMEQKIEKSSFSTISSRNIKNEGINIQIKKVRKYISTRKFLTRIKHVDKIYKGIR